MTHICACPLQMPPSALQACPEVVGNHYGATGGFPVTADRLKSSKCITTGMPQLGSTHPAAPAAAAGLASVPATPPVMPGKQEAADLGIHISFISIENHRFDDYLDLGPYTESLCARVPMNYRHAVCGHAPGWPAS